MTIERFDRIKRTTGLHHVMESNATLQKLADFPDTFKSMAYFHDLFRKVYSGEQPAADNREMTIGTMCAQVPDELIYAAGARPLRLCSGFNAYDQIGAELMPAKSCPVVRATLGMLQVHQSFFAEKLGGVVVPTTCDQKKKSAETLADYGFRVHILEMPPSKETEAARHYWQESVRQFAGVLQEWTGRRITGKGLKKAIDNSLKAGQVFRRLHELQAANPAVIHGHDVFLITNAYFFDDIKSWIMAVAEVCDEAADRAKKGVNAGSRRAPRILFTGSPPIFPNFKVPVLVAEAGGIIAADEVCSSSRLLYDAPSYDEANLYDMVPALADCYLKPCTCPCLTPNTDRQRKIVNMVKRIKADGVIYQAFSGCLPYEMEQKRIRSVLESENIPMLYVETDYSPEDLGQLSTRIEAFLESIKARSRKR